MSDTSVAGLEQAIDRLTRDESAESNESDLDLIADASANARLRGDLQDPVIFNALLRVFEERYTLKSWDSNPPPVSLLRSIGNLVADNDENRATLAANLNCMYGLKEPLSNLQPRCEDTSLVDFNIKILFNLCNEYPQAQRQAFEHGFHSAIADYIHVRTWTLDEDDSLLCLTLGLLTSIVEHKFDVQASEDQDRCSRVLTALRTIKTYRVDLDTLFDILSIICIYLQDKNFVLASAVSDSVPDLWDVLLHAEQEMSKQASEDPEDVDEKQNRTYLDALAQGLAELSSQSAFSDMYTQRLNEKFVRELCQKCLPQNYEDTGSKPSTIPACACLLLGNLTINDANTTTLAPMIPIDSLFQHLGTSTDAAFLNAVAGLLRHLATPLSNRTTYFRNPDYLASVAHLYQKQNLEQIQVAGLSLTRLLLSNLPDSASAFICGSNPPNLTSLLSFFSITTSTSAKIETSRIITTLLRTLQPPSSQPSTTHPTTASSPSLLQAPTNTSTALQKLAATPNILLPLLFAITTKAEAGFALAQADGWVGLNLLARVRGPCLDALAKAVCGDEVRLLLEERLRGGRGTDGSRVEGAVEEGDTRPEWVGEKERDNAVVLVHDLLKAVEVGEAEKEKLREVLRRCGVRLTDM